MTTANLISRYSGKAGLVHSGLARRGWLLLLLLGGIVLAVGATTQWSALVALGIAPFLLAALPCAAMCTLGLCMAGMAGRQTGAKTNASENAVALPPSVEPLQLVAPSSVMPLGSETGATSVPTKSC